MKSFERKIRLGGGGVLVLVISAIALLFAGIFYVTTSATTRGQSPVADGTVFASTLYEGTWDGGTWTINNEGLLTISGSGSMSGSYENRYWDNPSYRSSIHSVIIENGVTSIAYDAFYNCSSLVSITIPSSVTSIGITVFEGCSSLTDLNHTPSGANDHLINWPNWITTIPRSTFARCSAVTSVVIPESVTSIGVSVFEGCSSLTDLNHTPSGANDHLINWPNWITTIPETTFRGCSSITNVVIPETVVGVDWYTFNGCTSLADLNHTPSGANDHLINWPSWITVVNDYLFQDCSAITNVTIPSTVTMIGDMNFYNCNNLKVVNILVSEIELHYDDYGYFFFTSDYAINSNLLTGGYYIKVPTQAIADYYKSAGGYWEPYQDIIVVDSTLPGGADYVDPNASSDTGVVADIVLPSVLVVTIATVAAMYLLTFKRKKRI